MIAAVIASILFYRFLNAPARQAKALSISAMHARHRKNWSLAARFYSESHNAAAKLKEPQRTQTESQVEAQWAAVLYREGELHEAEEMLRRGLSKGERYFAPESEMLVQGHLCWGDLCADEGRHPEAEDHYRKALGGDEPNDNIAGVMFDLQRLGDCLIHQERRAEAEAVIERAVALETRHAREFATSRGMDPDDYLLTPTSLPALHFCREQYEDARRLYRGQVEHWETQAKRPDNIDIGQLRMKLAMAEARSGHLEEAIIVYEQAATAFERDWSEGHPKALAARQAGAALAAGAQSRV